MISQNPNLQVRLIKDNKKSKAWRLKANVTFHEPVLAIARNNFLPMSAFEIAQVCNEMRFINQSIVGRTAQSEGCCYTACKEAVKAGFLEEYLFTKKTKQKQYVLTQQGLNEAFSYLINL